MERYGKKAAERTPPVRKMLEMGIPVGAGTDATRVASYNPWVSLCWMVTGKTVGGVSMYPEKSRLTREEALRLYTQGSSWFSSESGKKGAIAAGQLADFAVLTDDYFSVPEEEIKGIESALTVVGGKIVYARDEFASHAPPAHSRVARVVTGKSLWRLRCTIGHQKGRACRGSSTAPAQCRLSPARLCTYVASAHQCRRDGQKPL